jgi:hypothetical protein
MSDRSVGLSKIELFTATYSALQEVQLGILVAAGAVFSEESAAATCYIRREADIGNRADGKGSSSINPEGRYDVRPRLEGRP